MSQRNDYQVTLAQVDANRHPEITLYVNVRDAGGNHVAGLTRERFRVTEDGRAVTLADFAGTRDKRIVDIVFVFDTTGSMSDEIDGVKETCIEFAQKLVDKERNYRLGLVTFGDAVRAVYRSDDDLTANAEEFKEWIGKLKARGGGGEKENPFGAIKRALRMNFRAGTQKIFILITDAPPHHYGDPPDSSVRFSDQDLRVERIATLLQDQVVTLYAITMDHDEYRQLADDTNGDFYKLKKNTDFTDLIANLGAQISHQYRLVYTSPRDARRGDRDIVVNIVNASAPAPRPASAAATTLCVFCGASLRTNARFCAQCGNPAVSGAAIPMTACARCGKPMRVGAVFCSHCGARR
jgi:VWFA-related protein